MGHIRDTSGTHPGHIFVTSGSHPGHIRATSGPNTGYIRATSGPHPDHIRTTSGSPFHNFSKYLFLPSLNPSLLSASINFAYRTMKIAQLFIECFLSLSTKDLRALVFSEASFIWVYLSSLMSISCLL